LAETCFQNEIKMFMSEGFPFH